MNGKSSPEELVAREDISGHPAVVVGRLCGTHLNFNIYGRLKQDKNLTHQFGNLRVSAVLPPSFRHAPATADFVRK